MDAERFIAGIEASKSAGLFVDPALSRLTVQDWAAQWLDGQTHLKHAPADELEDSVTTQYPGVVRYMQRVRFASAERHAPDEDRDCVLA